MTGNKMKKIKMPSIRKFLVALGGQLFRRSYLLPSRAKQKQQGVSMIETLITLPVMLMLGFGGWQGALMYEAQTTLNHAAFMAARAGSMQNMSITSMYEAFDRVISIIEREDGIRVARGRDDPEAIAQIFIANPTREVFQGGSRWALPPGQCSICGPGEFELPFTHLALRDRTERGGISLQDANILRIKVIYYYELTVPLVGDLIGSFSENPLAGGLHPTYPMTAVATVRMQSPAIWSPAGGDYLLNNDCVDYLADGSGNRNQCPNEMFQLKDDPDHDLHYFGAPGTGT